MKLAWSSDYETSINWLNEINLPHCFTSHQRLVGIQQWQDTGGTVQTVYHITCFPFSHWERLFKIRAVCYTKNRKSLFVSMNTQAIKASIIQDACREKPSCAVHWCSIPRLLMLFRQHWNNTNATELLDTRKEGESAATLKIKRS